MEERKYTISMYTPIGIRHGVMSATTKQNKITGTIEILEHTEPFEGIIESDGNCVIKGSIISLMKTMEYIATGKITKENVCLQLKGKKNTFMISGMVSFEEGSRIYE